MKFHLDEKLKKYMIANNKLDIILYSSSYST